MAVDQDGDFNGCCDVYCCLWLEVFPFFSHSSVWYHTGPAHFGGTIFWILFYIQEIDTFFSPGVSIPLGYISGRSGWKAVQGTWDQGATVQLNNANEAGAYRRNTNSGAVAIHFIKFYSPNANTKVFYRIGIKNGSNIKISDITISYGIT